MSSRGECGCARVKKQLVVVEFTSFQDWYFSVEDVVQILTDSVDVKQYIKKLKSRDPELNNNWGTICTLVEMIAKDGKKRKVRTANTK